MRFKNNIELVIIPILASPLIIYHLIGHIFELILMRSQYHQDKLFMKRFNLIDRKHINDFIDWNNAYHNKRNKKGRYESY